MTPFECYCEYVSLKNHFTKPTYDYIKYNGKTRLKPSSFANRKDRIFFEKLAKVENCHEYLLANLSIDPKLWIRDLAYSDIASVRYRNWKRRQQSLAYVFKNETEEWLCKPFNFNFICKDGEHPYLLRSLLSGNISLDTLCILLELTNAKQYWDKKMKYDILWDDYSLRVAKYTPFIKYDKDKFRKIVLDFYGDER